MIIRLHIKTPPGHAESVAKQLRIFLLGRLKEEPETYIHPDGTEFYWQVNCGVKKYLSIQRNAYLFQQLAQGTLDQINKRTWIKKIAKITDGTVKGAKKLIEETSIDIIKQAAAEEIVEAQETLWERIKRTFKKA